MDQELFNERVEFVSYNETHSVMLPLKCGVPQGFVLESLLFIIYINDICNIYTIQIGLFCTQYQCFNSCYMF